MGLFVMRKDIEVSLQSDLMTKKELVDFFPGKTLATIDYWLSKGVLPRDRIQIKVGKTTYFLRSELEKIIQEKRNYKEN